MPAAPPIVATRAARVVILPSDPKDKQALASDVMMEYLIGPHDLELIYMSPDPYGRAFEASLDLQKCDID
jgi:hypothetical protein